MFTYFASNALALLQFKRTLNWEILVAEILVVGNSGGGDFGGGGTGFWAGNRAVDENPQSPPDLVLKPVNVGASVPGSISKRYARQIRFDCFIRTTKLV